MKIKSIKKDDTRDNVYIVIFRPNFVQGLFGVMEEEVRYKDTGNTYYYGGGHVYVTQKGELVGNMSCIGEAIDNYRRSWS